MTDSFSENVQSIVRGTLDVTNNSEADDSELPEHCA